jgi:hypothetical protein
MQVFVTVAHVGCSLILHDIISIGGLKASGANPPKHAGKS